MTGALWLDGWQHAVYGLSLQHHPTTPQQQAEQDAGQAEGSIARPTQEAWDAAHITPTWRNP